MTDFKDNPEFIAIDEDFCGDGESDESTQPLSTYKEHRIDANTRALVDQPMSIDWSPRVDLDRGQFVSSKRWTFFYWFPLRVPHEADEVKIQVDGLLGTEESSPSPAPSVEVRAGLYIRTGLGFDRVPGTTQDTTTFDEDDQENWILNIQTDTSQTDTAEGYRLLWLGIEQRSPVNYEIDEPWLPSEIIEEENVFAFINDHITEGAFNDRESGSIAMATPGDPSALNGDILGAVVFDKKEFILPTKPPLESDVVQGSIKIHYLAWLSVHNVHVSIHSDGSTATSTYQPQPSDRMRPQAPVMGQDVSRHPRNIDHLYRRWRPVGQGPITRSSSGRDLGDQPGSDWIADWYQRWSWCPAHEDGNLQLAQSSINLPFPRSEVSVDMSFFGCEFWIDPSRFEQSLGGGSVGIGSPPRFGGSEPDNIDSEGFFQEYIIRWPTTIRIEQMINFADWSADPEILATKDFDLQLRLWMASSWGQRPLLKMMVCAFHDNTPQVWQFLGQHYVNEPRHIAAFGNAFYRRPQGTGSWDFPEEFRYLTTHSETLRIDPDESGVDPDMPARVLIETRNDEFDVNEGLQNHDGDALELTSAIKDRIHMWLTTYTIHARGY